MIQNPIAEAIALLQSAHEIAMREGRGTDWDAFKNCITSCLIEFGKFPVTARTFRLVEEFNANFTGPTDGPDHAPEPAGSGAKPC
jgi:hypothetical protein